MQEIDVWWHGIAALPADRSDQNYHALRRVWGDHTMAGNRGFYRTNSEDHITATLFQNWAALPGQNWAICLVRYVGGAVKGSIRRVRWAYECNEFLDAKLQPFHKRNFIIPDIMMVYEDNDGVGLIAFEVKKPGKAVNSLDARKLMSYMDLPSTRSIKRRYGCILVGERMMEKSNRACEGKWPILSWEQLANFQSKEVERLQLQSSLVERATLAIRQHFGRHGIGSELSARSVHADTKQQYKEIDALPAPDCLRRFLKGSACVDAVWNRKSPDPPLSWLNNEPTARQIRVRSQRGFGWQTNEDRMICRWSFDWHPGCERVWK
jgi:hypothetical protein